MKAFWLITKGSVDGQRFWALHTAFFPDPLRRKKVKVHGLWGFAECVVHEGCPFPSIGGRPPLWKHMESIGAVGLQQREGVPSCSQKGLPCPSDSSELVSAALGFCLMPIQGCQGQDQLNMQWGHGLTAMQPFLVNQAFQIWSGNYLFCGSTQQQGGDYLFILQLRKRGLREVKWSEF